MVQCNQGDRVTSLELESTMAAMPSNVIEITDRPPQSEDVRQGLLELQNAMVGHPRELPKTAGVVDHFFGGGVYVRVWQGHAGMIVVGVIHKFDVISLLLQGRVLVGDEYEGAREIVAPSIWLAPAGVKRAVRVVEDCIWATAHADPGVRTEEEIRAHLSVESYEELYE